MPDESDFPEEDAAARKRQLRETNTLNHTPLKKAKSSTSNFGLLSSITSLFGFGMFNSESDKQDTSEGSSSAKEHSVFEEDDDDVVTLRSVASPVKKANRNTPIVYLNDDVPHVKEVRAESGSDIPTIKTEEIEEDPVMIGKIVGKGFFPKPRELIYLNADQPSPSRKVVEEEEKDCSIVEKSMEMQEEDDCRVIADKANGEYEKENNDDFQIIKEIKRKSVDRLSSARRVQNELVYLNATQEDDNESDGCSVQSTTSPTPDDSASRAGTPMCWKEIDQSPSGSGKIRDYWRRNKKTPKRTPVRSFGGNTSILRVSQSKIKKSNQEEIQLEAYKKALFRAGILTEMNLDRKFNVPKIGSARSNAAAVLIKKAKKAIDFIQSSREGTPTPSEFGSRSSTIYSEDGVRHRAGTHSVSISSDTSTTETKLNDIVSKLNSVNLVRTRDFEKYNVSSERSFQLSEELRIRELCRKQGQEDNEESVRKKLELRGIYVRPPKAPKTEFVALSAESAKLCDRVWDQYQPQDEMFAEDFNIKLCRKDLITLEGLSWLNDEVINFYLQLIIQRSEKDPKYPKVYAFNTFFYTNITTKPYATVRRWTKKIDIFACDVVLVPVHLHLHWCMAVIDMKLKRVDYYDSLLGNNPVCLEALKKYLMNESMDKKKTPFDFKGWTFNTMKDIPTQHNGSDCGVFSCQFGEFASRRMKPIFTQEHMQYYRKRMLFELCNKKLLSSI